MRHLPVVSRGCGGKDFFKKDNLAFPFRTRASLVGKSGDALYFTREGKNAMSKVNKHTRPNKSTGETYIYRNPRELKNGSTEIYTVRFPIKFGIKSSKSFTGAGAFQKAINWRNAVARNQRIVIQPENYKFNYKPPKSGGGKKGRIDLCGPNFFGDFEFHVKTDDGQRVRRIIDKSQFGKAYWVKIAEQELGILFTAEMFQRCHHDLLGKNVYVIASNKFDGEYRITSCRPDWDASHEQESNQQEEVEVIEISQCDKEKTIQFTPEQQAEIDRIVASRLEKALIELADRIVPYPAAPQKEHA